MDLNNNNNNNKKQMNLYESRNRQQTENKLMVTKDERRGNKLGG